MPGTGGARIGCVIGTRAQLIKMAPVLVALEARGVPYRLVFTGQHRETMGALLGEFGVRTAPVYLYEGAEITGIAQMGAWFLRCWRRFRADPGRYLGDAEVVLVHGDTFSTLLGALMGRHVGARVAHVESGLRSFHFLHPFPEEITRLCVFRLSQIAYCPGDWAVRNLARYRLVRVNMGHNTLLDAVRIALARPRPRVAEGDYVVCSIHRFENIVSRRRLARVLDLIERARGDLRAVFVLHPATRRRLVRFGLMERLAADPQVTLLPRMGYFDFLHLVRDARFVITDGGSNQEELSYLGVPTLLMRKATERREGLGDRVVLSRYRADVVDAFARRHHRSGDRRTLPSFASPSEIIVDHLLSELGR